MSAPSGTPRPLVLVAFGSNLGDSPALIRIAMNRVEQLAGHPVERSSLWVSTPVDCPSGSPLFTNAAVVFPLPEGWSPETWLVATQRLERELGRDAKMVLNEARRMDVDLIAWGNEIRDTAVLTLPHARAHLRRFVLQPLAELIPLGVLPGRKQTIAELLAGCAEDPQFRRLNV